MAQRTSFIDVFSAAATQAGAVARHLQGEIGDRSKTGEETPEAAALSAADLAAQDVILLRLGEALSDVAVDAEEDTATARRFPRPAPERPLVVLDPIDGSLAYLRGSPDYAVMGAWIEGGVYRASLMYFPAWRETYWAVRGGGCYRRPDGGEAGRVSLGELPPRILVPPPTPRGIHQRVAELGYRVEVSRCSAIDTAAPALGRAVGSANADPPDRRRAIGFLLCVEAGGAVLFEHGHWRGEDPEAEGFAGTAHAVADSADRAARLLEAIR